MILSGQTIKSRQIIHPHRERFIAPNGLSGGQGNASYDVTSAADVTLYPMHLCYRVNGDAIVPIAHRPWHQNIATAERLELPNDVGAWFALKSTHARMGIQQPVTWIDPGFEGDLVVELCNAGTKPVFIQKGSPIGQIVFVLSEPTQGYQGRYQDQSGAQGPIFG